jgi:tRNA threonylcarbamoyl adenosine modification protein YeaZ
VYLLIDTSTKNGAVGLWRDGAVGDRETWNSPHNHTAELMPAIDRLLVRAGMAPAALAGIGVAKGPGGFSALRAGLGAAKGLALALGMPLVGIGTLEAAAYPHRHDGASVCAMVEAGRNAVAWAIFQGLGTGQDSVTGDGSQAAKPRGSSRVGTIDEALAEYPPGTLFVDEGAAVHADAIRSAGARVTVPGAEGRLAGLGALAARRLDAGDADAVDALEPHYARPPTIGQPKAAKDAQPKAARGIRKG